MAISWATCSPIIVNEIKSYLSNESLNEFQLCSSDTLMFRVSDKQLQCRSSNRWNMLGSSDSLQFNSFSLWHWIHVDKSAILDFCYIRLTHEMAFHYACRNGDIEAAKMMISMYEDQITITTNSKFVRRLLKAIVIAGHVHILDYLESFVRPYTDFPERTIRKLFKITAKAGHVHMLEHLYFRTRPYFFSNTNLILAKAARHGHVQIFQLLYSVVGLRARDFVKDARSIIMAAAKHGHVQIFKFLYHVARVSIVELLGPSNIGIELAVRHGHMNILNFLYHDANVKLKNFRCICWAALDVALKHGELDIVTFFYHTVKLKVLQVRQWFEPDVLQTIVAIGQFDMFKFLYNVCKAIDQDAAVRDCDSMLGDCRSMLSNHDVVMTATNFGRLDILKFLYETIGLAVHKNCTCLATHRAVNLSALGYLHSIKYFSTADFQNFYARAMDNVAFEWNVEILDFLHRVVGLSPQDLLKYDALHKFAKGGYVSILRFFCSITILTASDFRFHETGILGDIIQSRGSKVLKFLYNSKFLTIHDFRMDANHILHTAIKSNNLEIVQFLCTTVKLTPQDFESRSGSALYEAAMQSREMYNHIYNIVIGRLCSCQFVQ